MIEMCGSDDNNDGLAGGIVLSNGVNYCIYIVIEMVNGSIRACRNRNEVGFSHID